MQSRIIFKHCGTLEKCSALYTRVETDDHDNILLGNSMFSRTFCSHHTYNQQPLKTNTPARLTFTPVIYESECLLLERVTFQEEHKKPAQIHQPHSWNIRILNYMP